MQPRSAKRITNVLFERILERLPNCILLAGDDVAEGKLQMTLDVGPAPIEPLISIVDVRCTVQRSGLPRLKKLFVDAVQEPQSRKLVRRVLNNNGGYADHFREKTSNDVHAGPYAILVRDVAFYAEALSQHNYLRMPEIIEDLCSEVEALADIDLTENFRTALRPAIVKFTSEATGSAQREVATALCYVWAGFHKNGKPDSNSIWCFDGENAAVPASNILQIQYVEENLTKLL